MYANSPENSAEDPKHNSSETVTPKIIISSRPRDFRDMRKIELEEIRKKNKGMQVTVDMTSISKARVNQLMEPLKRVNEKIDVEHTNLESLKVKKLKLKNKLLEVYTFLLKNPGMIL